MFSEADSQTDSALVYVYRLDTPPYKRKPDVLVDETFIAELPTESYTILRLKPGMYTIKTDWGLLDNLILSRSTTLTVAAGKSYYVNFAGKLGIFGTVATYGAHVLSGEITSIPTELRTCSYVAPRISLLGPK